MSNICLTRNLLEELRDVSNYATSTQDHLSVKKIIVTVGENTER